MVTTTTNYGRSGVSDWLVQRISAVILLAYFIFIACATAGGTDYVSWRALFDQTWVKIFSLAALLSVAAHAWIGLWVVLTDYLTERLMGTLGNVLRIAGELFVLAVLFVYVVWGIQILWGY
ncbi:MAG: succinate dehydrogenase, hydrophobic membrane anchor protein [Parahaliea sp.]